MKNSPLPRVEEALRIASRFAGKVERMVDLGCGDGEIALMFNEKLKAREVYGVDINERAISLARQRGIKAYPANLSENSLPFPNEFFDLVLSLEAIEHLINPDNMLKEAYRVLRRDGYLLISTPNLASWVNRLLLLLGYQPYNVEVSTETMIGVPIRKGVFGGPAGHIRAFTLRALKRALEYYGFRIMKAFGAPGVNPENRFFRLLDRLFSLRASLARRLMVLAVKS